MIFYITAGSRFENACPGEHVNLKWTFQASNQTAIRKSGLRRETDFLTFNKTICIGNVKETDAGKYTCWTRLCDKYSQKLLTINLCVITGEEVTHIQYLSSVKNGSTFILFAVNPSTDSSVSCALLCDMESNNPNGIPANFSKNLGVRFCRG